MVRLDARGRWTAGIVVAVAAAIGWRALGAGSETVESAHGPAPVEGGTAAILTATGRAPRTDVLVEAVHEPATDARTAPHTSAEPEVTPLSPLARELDQVAASFLTPEPRVSELLEIVELLAARAAVDAEGVVVQEGAEGELKSSRGTLTVGDLQGRFLIDQDSYGIEFSAPGGDPRWSRRVVHVTFQEGDGGPRACHVIVQFEPAPEAALAADAEREKLVGWAVGTSLEEGTVARALTLHPVEGAWTVGASEELEALELPWVSGMRGFEAWMRLLEPHTSAAGAPR